MLLWPRLVCGATAVPQSSPGLRLPMLSGRRQLAAQGPSLFFRLTWSGDSLRWLEVWRGQSYAFSQWLCLQSVLSISPRFHYRRLAFCFLPLAAMLESPFRLILVMCFIKSNVSQISFRSLINIKIINILHSFK
jgi:hypothetical protein